jgi:hypothetical protein
MDNNQQQEQAMSRKMKIIFAAASTVAVILVFAVGYILLSRIKATDTLADAATSQEQFEGSPEISSNLQQECQQSAVKLTTLRKIEQLEAEFESHAANCRDVYFAIDFQSPFRREGMYPDLAVDLAHQAFKEDKNKAHEILNFAKTLKAWDFYLGPVSCDSHHVIDAYIESLDLPTDKLCVKLSDYKTKLIPELQNKNFEILKRLLANDDTVWMGQPESDMGCPEKISSIVQIVKKLSEGNIKVEEPKLESDENTDIFISIKDKETEKVGLVFRSENECLQIKTVLVPNLEVSE